MKVVYATLAGSAMAAAPLRNYLEDQIDQVFQPTEDGFQINFAPYLVGEVSDYGLTGQWKYSADGVNTNVDNWAVQEDGAEFWGEHYGSNFQDLGFEAANYLEKISYKENISWGADASGVQIDGIIRGFASFYNGEEGSMNERFSLTVDVSTSGKAASVSLDAKAKRTADNMDAISDTLFYQMYVQPFDVDLSSTINVSNMAKCEDLGAGCAVTIDNSLTLDGNVMEAPQLSFAIKKYAAVFKAEGMGVAFLRRVNRANQGQPLDAEMGWLSFHYAEGGNWQQAVRSGQDTLVLRTPTHAQWMQDAFPELEALAEPFVDLIDAMIQNPEKIPYMIYYFDDLLATLDNEFDCSDYVEATNTESDLVAEWLGVESLNDAAADFCEDLNREVVDALQNDDIVDVMQGMRDYVTDMNSPSGHAEFEQIFGGIF